MHAEAREEFKNNLPDDYLSRCKVDYINASKDSDFFESHPENFDALTQIIKSAPIDHHHTGRSHKFGYIYFTNFDSPDYVIVLDFNSYYKSGYVCITIYEGDPHTSNFVEDYYSEELLEWARENFPEEFEKMKDLKPHWFFGNIALYVFLALGFLAVLLNSISGKKR